MGMFDEIMVPKGYLKSLLNKEDEKLLEKNHLFQTKDLDNLMDLYKVHRQYLYKKKKEALPFEEWEKLKKNAVIRFHDYLTNKDHDEYSIEFQFSFKNGKVDKKELLKFTLESTKKESEETQKMWDTEQKIFGSYRDHSLKYRLFSRMENCFQKITNWARNKHCIPLNIRQEAYEKSGRLKKDPHCLDLYKDL
tara:strand:- start:8051 stop:8629 length:579 start_codon:yes stop_codon:yes gene_type:complete